ncbi:beta-ketoacyl synthase N-terminal-like domain-containing protein [Methylobacterium fujisawaense]|uniref:beta-ketoacyl synthase N-terminal-like domain-containing protein n=1 Tax=Methylobacterium fujisawaense TaxID=107400 RepID=UPI003CECC0E6
MTSSAPQAVIASIGLCCPLGESFNIATAAYANGDRGFKKPSCLVGSDGFPPTLAHCLPVETGQNYAIRLYHIFDKALKDCLDRAPDLSKSWYRGFELHVMLPAWMEHNDIYQKFHDTLLAPSASRITRIVSYFGEEAHSLALIDVAVQKIRKGGADTIFIAGLDSHIYPMLLDRLDAKGLMLNRNNPYGFIPGEACAVILLTERKLCPSPMGEILGFGSGSDVVAPAADAAPIRGEGLANALRAVARALKPGDVPRRVLTDLNGARWRAEQHGFAVSRIGQILGDRLFDPECHCLAVGHAGSATGAMMIALALGPPPGKRGDEPDRVNVSSPVLAIATNPSGYSYALMLQRKA